MKIISSRRRPLRRAASPAGITIIRGRGVTAEDEAQMLEALFDAIGKAAPSADTLTTAKQN